MLPSDWKKCLAPVASRADRAAVQRLAGHNADSSMSSLLFWTQGDCEQVLRFLSACPSLTYVFWWIDRDTGRRFVRCSRDLDAVRSLLTSGLCGSSRSGTTQVVMREALRLDDGFELVDRFLGDVMARDDMRPLVLWRIDGDDTVYVDAHRAWSLADARQHLNWLLGEVLDTPAPAQDGGSLATLMAARAAEHLMLPTPPGPPLYRPDWRQRRLSWLLERGRRPRRGVDDESTRLAYRLLTSGSHTTRSPKSGSLLAARDIADGPLLQRSVLEAWLLTGQSGNEIAANTGIDSDVVNWFEKLHFAVFDRLQAHDLLLKVAVGRVEPEEPPEQQIAAFLKRNAYLGGVDVLRATVNCLPKLLAVANGGRLQIRPEDPPATTYLQLLLAHQRLPPNPMLEMRLAAMLSRVHMPETGEPDLIADWVSEKLAASPTGMRMPGRTRQHRAAAG